MSSVSPNSGRVENGEHVFRLRVYYEDTDAGGIVYHSNYLKYAERARTEMLRTADISQWELLGHEGVAFAVRDLFIDFKQPAQLDDELVVRSRPADMKGASVTIEQRVFRNLGEREEELARLTVRVACRRANGRAARIPKMVRDAFALYTPGGEAEF